MKSVTPELATASANSLNHCGQSLSGSGAEQRKMVSSQSRHCCTDAGSMSAWEELGTTTC